LFLGYVRGMSVGAEKNINFFVGKCSDSCKALGIDGWII
jgi:hypothetical protein